MPVVERDFKLDFSRLSGTNQTTDHPVGYTTGSAPAAPAADPGGAANAPAVNAPAVVHAGGMAGGGSRATRIIAEARTLMRDRPDSTNYYFQPEVACASFVATVLETAGILAPSPLLHDTHVGDPRRYCPSLPPFLEQQGAGRVFAGTRPLVEAQVEQALIPGDIIFYWRNSRGRFGHVEIYIGNGFTIGNSSSARRATEHKAVNLRGTYQSFTGWRFS